MSVSAASESITSHLEAIIDAIVSAETIEVVSPTGSGKSSILPATLAQRDVRVFVSVPTRTSARTLYDYVSSIYPDLTVGYAAEGEVKYNNTTQLTYATSGHLRRKMYEYFRSGRLVDSGLSISDILIVDEIHSGSVDNTFILSLWMEARRQVISMPSTSQASIPRLVLTTATPVPLTIEPEPIKYIAGNLSTPFVVAIEYTQDYKTDQDRLTAMVTRAAQIHRETAISTGHILLFFPGSANVDTAVNGLNELGIQNAIIVGVYGQSSKEDIQRIYTPAPPGFRKIVASTNMAESSITIEGLGYVLDSMEEKRPGTSNTGGHKLTTSFISKKSADQRKGRTGRTIPGKCIRFVSERAYEGFEVARTFDINVVPIHSEIIELLSAGLNPLEVLKGVDGTKIVDTMKSLGVMGMLKPGASGSIEVSDVGKFAADIPLSIRQISFLWEWIQSRNHPFIGVVAASLIDSDPQNIFKYPRKIEGESISEFNDRIREHADEYWYKYTKSDGDDNHLETVLRVWNDLVSTVGDAVFEYRGARAISKWCRDNWIGYKKINEIISMVKHVSSSTSRSTGVNVQKGRFDPVEATTKATPILLRVNRDMEMVRQGRSAKYMHKGTRDFYMLARRGIPGDIQDNPSLIVLSSVMNAGKKGPGMGIISMAIPNFIVTPTFDMLADVQIQSQYEEPQPAPADDPSLSGASNLPSPFGRLPQDVVVTPLPGMYTLSPQGPVLVQVSIDDRLPGMNLPSIADVSPPQPIVAKVEMPLYALLPTEDVTALPTPVVQPVMFNLPSSAPASRIMTRGTTPPSQRGARGGRGPQRSGGGTATQRSDEGRGRGRGGAPQRNDRERDSTISKPTPKLMHNGSQTLNMEFRVATTAPPLSIF
jgi:HrpA-like RNA helicase